MSYPYAEGGLYRIAKSTFEDTYKWQVVLEEGDGRIKSDFYQKRYKEGENPTTDEYVTKVLHDNAQKLQDKKDNVHHINLKAAN